MTRITLLLAGTASALMLLSSCSGGRRVDPFDTIGATPAPWDLIDENDSLPRAPQPVAEALPADTAADPAPTETDDTPPAPAANMSRYNRIGRLNELFNDSNKYQYAAGERIGIAPISGVADAYYTRRPLVRIGSCRWYDVDELTHSMPYLVPEAATLLETIGRNFTDSLARRNARGYKFRVTSVLRSAYSVKRLRRVNRNATDSSTHQLGTTFDISYAHFNHDGNARQVSDEELKYILAEVLRDLRQQNKCMVKFERKSPCFHITATGL